MGNCATADCKLLSLDSISDVSVGGDIKSSSCNLKAWKFTGKYSIQCTPVELINTTLELDKAATYLVLVLKANNKKEEQYYDFSDSSCNAASVMLSDTFTPRGLKYPFSVLGGVLTKTVYIFYGTEASPLAKAKALKRGLEIEKLLDREGFAASLLTAGEPKPIPTSIITANLNGTSRTAPHLLRIIHDNEISMRGGSNATPAENTPSSLPSSSPSTSVVSSPGDSSLNASHKRSAWSSPDDQQPASTKTIIPALTGLSKLSVPGLALKQSPQTPQTTTPSSSCSPPEQSIHSDRSNLNNSTKPIGLGLPLSGLKLPLAGVGQTPIITSTTAIDSSDEEPPSARRDPPPASDREISPQQESEEDVNEKAMHEDREWKMKDASSVCSEVLPWLCVSGQLPAETLETLLNTGITDIVNTAEMVCPCKYPDYFNYYPIRMRDSPSENIMTYFPHCVAAIDAARKNDGKILVHCHQGVSRSVTLVAAYLMWKDCITAEEAVDKVRESRNVARPNAGFLFRLSQWEAHLMHPQPVNAYRLTPFSDERPAQPVFALERFGIGSSPKSMDSRTTYLITRWRDKKVWLWRGRDCHEVTYQVAEKLVPDICYHAMRTSEDSSDRLRWPGGVVENPILISQDDLKNDSDFIEALQSIDCDIPAKGESFTVSEYAYQPTEFAAWLQRRSASISNAESLKEARDNSKSSSKLQMEQMNVRDMFICNEDRSNFTKDDLYHSEGIDEDDWMNFQESMETEIAIFVKLRGEIRNVDIWFGEISLAEDEFADEHVDKVVDAFKAWTAEVCIILMKQINKKKKKKKKSLKNNENQNRMYPGESLLIGRQLYFHSLEMATMKMRISDFNLDGFLLRM